MPYLLLRRSFAYVTFGVETISHLFWCNFSIFSRVLFTNLSFEGYPHPFIFMDTLLNTITSKRWVTYGVLVILPFLLYWPVLTYSFSPLDEQWLIVHDAAFLKQWQNLKYCFTDAIHGIFYRPLLRVSLLFDFQMGQLNPKVYHLTNLIIHLINVVLVYECIKLLKTKSSIAFMLALIFAVHPLLLHAVAWIPGRNDSMLSLFVLLALMQLVNYLETGRVISLILHLLFSCCALLTKETAIVLPFLFGTFLLLYQVPVSKKKRLLLFGFWSLLTIVWWFVRMHFTTKSAISNTDFAHALMRFGIALAGNVGKLILPVEQSVSPTRFLYTAIAGVILLGVIVWLFKTHKWQQHRIALWALMLSGSTLAVAVWFGAKTSHGEQYEHRNYLPLIGALVAIGQLKFGQIRIMQYSLLGVFILFSGMTYNRMPVYKNDLTYIEDALKGCPTDYFLHYTMANSYAARGDYHNAVDALTEAHRLYPKKPEVIFRRAQCYQAMGKKKACLDDFDAAVNASNKYYDAIIGRVNAYLFFGDTAAALSDLEYLRRAHPTLNPQVHPKVVMFSIGMQLKEINRLIALNPDMALFYADRAKVFLTIGDKEKARLDFETACRLEPGNESYKLYLTHIMQ